MSDLMPIAQQRRGYIHSLKYHSHSFSDYLRFLTLVTCENYSLFFVFEETHSLILFCLQEVRFPIMSDPMEIFTSFPSLFVLSLFLFLPLLLLFLLTTTHTNGSSTKKSNLPPSPPKLPIIGNLHQLGSLPHRSLSSLSRKYGPLMLLNLGQVPTLVVSSADAAREVLKTHDHVFASRPSLKVARQLLYQSRDLAFAPYGERWRQLRKISATHLLSANKLQSYRAAREEEVAFMVEKISQSLSSTVNMSEEVSSFTNNLICRVASGKSSREAGRNEMLRELTEETGVLLGSFRFEDYLPTLGWLDGLAGLDARVRKASKKWDEVLDAVIEEHARHSEDDDENSCNSSKDFVDVLLSLQKDRNIGFTLLKDELKALVLDMFAAGTETSSVLLEWCMAELVKNSKAVQKLEEEVRCGAHGKSMVREEDLNGMKYLRAVVKEALRLHPPAPLLVPRESMGSAQVLGYEIPKGTRVIVNAWAIGRELGIWEAPDEFRPDRFMSSAIDFRGHDFQFIPFGAGRRVCPGLNFAISAVELALANLVYRFDLKLPMSTGAEDLDMTESSGLTVHLKKRLNLIVTPRSY